MRGDPARIQECKSRYDRGEVMPLKGCSDAHTVWGVLKLYLASLPEPLLSYRLYDSLLAVAAVPAQSRRILALGSLLEHLDPSSKTTLAAILAFLQRCATATAASNASGSVGGTGTGTGTGIEGTGMEMGMGMGMDAAGAHGDAVRTLASLFSPLLLRLRGAGEDGSGGGHLTEDVARADHVLELLIEHHTAILLGGGKDSGGGGGATRAAGGGAHKSGGVGLWQSSNGMNVSAGAGGETTNVTTGAATRAMRGLDLHDKENARAAAADKAAAAVKTDQQQQQQQQHVIAAQQQQHQHQHQQSTAIYLDSPAAAGTSGATTVCLTAAADVFEGIDALMGTCAGSLMGGDDLFTAEFDRVSGTGLDVLYRVPVHRLAPEELAMEKQAIKRRLRSFDNHVAACSGRKATKEDKRHLRPLYLRLAHVKRQIHVLETSGAGQAGLGGHSRQVGAGAGAGTSAGAGMTTAASGGGSGGGAYHHHHRGGGGGGGVSSSGGGSAARHDRQRSRSSTGVR